MLATTSHPHFERADNEARSRQRSRRVLVPEAWKAQMLPLHHIRLIKRSEMLTTQPGGNLKVLWNLQPEPLDFIEL